MLRRTRALLQQLTGTPTDRRLYPRHEIDVETDCHALADGTEMVVRIRNVSRTGANLMAPRLVPEGTMIRVKLPEVKDGAETWVLACVTNAREEGPDQWSLGCMFSLELSAAEMAAFGGVKETAAPGDQRAWIRCPVRGTVEYRVLPGDGAAPVAGELADLSPGGVGLILENRVDAGTALTVTLRRKDDKSSRQMLACVVYLSQCDDGKWAAGCQFLRELSDAELGELVWQSEAACVA